jgi:hypothetical protein
MLLNNLEQKLDGNEDLCRRVAKVIDMTVENSLLASRLGEIDTCIPEIEKRISALLSSCQNSCDRARNDVVSEICHMYADKGAKHSTTEYIIKIQKTIDNCIAEYATYKKSHYNAKYCQRTDVTQIAPGIKDDEMLLLI